MESGGDESREVGHVAQQEGTDVVRDLAELRRVDRAWIGGSAADDQAGARLTGLSQHLLVVDRVRLAADAVVGDRVEPPREVHLEAMRQMTSVRELEREDRVARLQRRHVHGHVGLGARVRLHVCVLGAEELLRAVDGQLLDLVHDLTATVVPLPRITLGVLVRRRGADRLHDRGPREVLRGDQLDLIPLTLGLPAEEIGDLRVEQIETCTRELLKGLLGDGHGSSPRVSWIVLPSPVDAEPLRREARLRARCVALGR